MYFLEVVSFCFARLQYRTKKWDTTFFYNFSTTIDSFATSDTSVVVIIQGKSSYIARFVYLLKFRELRRERSVSQLEKIAFLIRGKIRFFAYIFIDLTQEHLKRSQNVA